MRISAGEQLASPHILRIGMAVAPIQIGGRPCGRGAGMCEPGTDVTGGVMTCSRDAAAPMLAAAVTAAAASSNLNTAFCRIF